MFSFEILCGKLERGWPELISSQPHACEESNEQSCARVSPLYVGLDFMHSTQFPGPGLAMFSTLFNFTYIGQQVPFEKFGK